MVNCLHFLRKQKDQFPGSQGLTLIELLIVLTFIGAMAVFMIVIINPVVQMGKARDARRKADLQKLKMPLEDYYNDNKCYPPTTAMDCLLPVGNPGTGFRPYVSKVPCDPLSKQSYMYTRPSCDVYRIYAKLEYGSDPSIGMVGCSNGCGPGGTSEYNYGVSSSNVKLEPGSASPPTPGVTPAGCTFRTACAPDYCNVVEESSPYNPKYCDDPTCGGNCPQN